MGITKGLNWQNIFVFLFLVIFPFGQIIRIGNLQPIDFIVGLAALYTIAQKLEPPKTYKYLGNFLIFASFSWIVSIFIFRQTEALYGFLYLVRLTAYYLFGIYVWNFVKRGKNIKKLLLESLLTVSVISALFGWMQFFTVPDIKPFIRLGWDMHLFRLVGAFLDPTFLGLIIVFGLVISIHQYIEMKKKKHIFIIIFLLISLAFTYSRASYIALFAGLIMIAWRKNVLRKVLMLILFFAAFLILLPTSKNHSIELSRTFSAIAKIENYKSTLQIFFKSPVFGVGYNNMCLAYQKFVGMQRFSSHACSGSDSSLLFILATTGVLGFVIFVYSIQKVISYLKRSSSSYFIILNSCFVALLVHSLFSNSMFYPWIMGYLAILLTLAIKEQN